MCVVPFSEIIRILMLHIMNCLTCDGVITGLHYWEVVKSGKWGEVGGSSSVMVCA